jgi:hypothetical protein
MDIGSGIDAVLAQNEELHTIPEILQPNGEPYTAANGAPCTISVYGPESKAARKGKRTDLRKLIRRAGEPDLEDVEGSRIEKAAACVGAWTGWEANGVEAPCNHANVRLLLRAEHILAQVEAGIAKHAAFLSAAKAS